MASKPSINSAFILLSYKDRRNFPQKLSKETTFSTRRRIQSSSSSLNLKNSKKLFKILASSSSMKDLKNLPLNRTILVKQATISLQKLQMQTSQCKSNTSYTFVECRSLQLTRNVVKCGGGWFTARVELFTRSVWPTTDPTMVYKRA